MTLSYRVLGAAGRDNALLVTIDSGQAVSRLLFDCGDGCLNELSFADVQAIDHLFFSHFHMDHVGGFDTFFRCTFNRTAKENHVWGPPRTGEILQHRFQGYMWNLVADQQAAWNVHDLHPDCMETRRYELAEAFAQTHGTRPLWRTLFGLFALDRQHRMKVHPDTHLESSIASRTSTHTSGRLPHRSIDDEAPREAERWGAMRSGVLSLA